MTLIGNIMKKIEFSLNIVLILLVFIIVFNFWSCVPGFTFDKSDEIEIEIPGYKKLTFSVLKSGTFNIGSSNQTGSSDSEDLDFDNEELDDLDFLEEDKIEGETKKLVNEDEDSEEDEVFRSITLNYTFLASVNEVSQGFYKFIMKNNPSCFFWSGDDHPVEQVSWLDCLIFCNKLSELCGYDKCYNLKNLKCDFSKNGFRLPTESEWEYISRGQRNTIFFFGNQKDDLNKYANTSFNNLNKTMCTGSLKANQNGIFDVYGNVWEWCYDVYDSRRPLNVLNHVTDYDTNFSSDNEEKSKNEVDDDLDFLEEESDELDKSEEQISEISESVQEKKENKSIDEILSEKYMRIIKGGGWGSSYYDCRSANRGKGHPSGHYSDVGFRIVRTVSNK